MIPDTYRREARDLKGIYPRKQHAFEMAAKANILSTIVLFPHS